MKLVETYCEYYFKNVPIIVKLSVILCCFCLVLCACGKMDLTTCGLVILGVFMLLIFSFYVGLMVVDPIRMSHGDPKAQNPLEMQVRIHDATLGQRWAM